MTTLTDDAVHRSSPRTLRDEMIAFVMMAALLAIVPLTGIYPFFVMQALCFALLACAFNLLIGYRRTAVVRPRDVPGHRGLFHRACAEGVGRVARDRNSARHRRRRGACRHHRRGRDPPPGHLFRDDHAGALAAAVFRLSADAVHPWRGRHPGHPARAILFGVFNLVQTDHALLRHPGRLPARLPA